MNKCTIFYFSGTGNTQWAARRLASALIAGGIDTSLVNIEDVTPLEAGDLIGEASLVGFCYPIYGSDVPMPMQDFMMNLPPLGPRTYLGLCTQLLFSGDGVRVMLPFLRKSQGDVRVSYARHIMMPNNISFERYGLRVLTDSQKLHEIFEEADLRIAAFAHAILNGEKMRQGMNPGSRLLGLIQRGPYRLCYGYLMSSFSVDQKKCSRCDICRQICPMGNITTDYEIGRNCCLCQRCYNYCPMEAVKYRGKRGKNKAYQGPEGYFPALLAHKRERGK